MEIKNEISSEFLNERSTTSISLFPCLPNTIWWKPLRSVFIHSIGHSLDLERAIEKHGRRLRFCLLSISCWFYHQPLLLSSACKKKCGSMKRPLRMSIFLVIRVLKQSPSPDGKLLFFIRDPKTDPFCGGCSGGCCATVVERPKGTLS